MVGRSEGALVATLVGVSGRPRDVGMLPTSCGFDEVDGAISILRFGGAGVCGPSKVFRLLTLLSGGTI